MGRTSRRPSGHASGYRNSVGYYKHLIDKSAGNSALIRLPPELRHAIILLCLDDDTLLLPMTTVRSRTKNLALICRTINTDVRVLMRQWRTRRRYLRKHGRVIGRIVTNFRMPVTKPTSKNRENSVNRRRANKKRKRGSASMHVEPAPGSASGTAVHDKKRRSRKPIRMAKTSDQAHRLRAKGTSAEELAEIEVWRQIRQRKKAEMEIYGL